MQVSVRRILVLEIEGVMGDWSKRSGRGHKKEEREECNTSRV